MNVKIITIIVLCFIDYITGVSAAFYNSKLSSKIGWKGIVKKLTAFIIFLGCYVLELFLINEKIISNAIISTSYCVFYVCNELISICENANKMNIKMPKIIKQIIERLSDNEK